MRQLWTGVPVTASQEWLKACRRSFHAAIAPFCPALLLGFGIQAADIKVSATLDRSAITLGESATLSIAFEGGGPQSPPGLPAIDGLQMAYLGPSSRTVIINGQVNSTVTHIYRVTPQKPGDYTIPAIVTEVGGQKLSTQPLLLKVGQPSAPPKGSVNAGAEVAFMKLVVSKPEIYVGEIAEAELQLYLRQDVQELLGFQTTTFPADGFSLGKMFRGQPRQTQIGRTAYTIVPFVMTVRAGRTGQMTLGPVTATVVVERAAPNRRRSFFDFGFPGGEQEQLTLATEPQTVNCRPLPAQNVPPSFNGAVGNYAMAATASPTNIAVGDPVTVKVQISGRGALENITLPEQQSWKNFKTYPPTTKLETTDNFGVQGTKTFEQTIVPSSPEVREVPPFTFSFFDPAQKAYRTLTAAAIPLLVRPSGSLPTPVVARTAEQDQPASQDIVHIKPRLGQFAQIAPPLQLRPWFIAAQAVPVLAWAGSLAWKRRREKLANNPRLRRRRQVFQIVENGMTELRAVAQANESEQFYATLFRLLQEQLGDSLDLPASAITEAVIEEHLVPRRTPENVIQGVRELFEKCNLAKYAAASSSEELSAVVPRFEAVVKQLRELRL